MKKLFLGSLILAVFSVARSAQAQYYPYGGGYNSYSSGYNYGYSSYNFLRNASTPDRVGFGINQFFNALDYTTAQRDQMRAQEAAISARQNQLENYKSVQRIYTEGVPPFAPVGPDGRKRSENITWDDIQKIR